MVNVGIVISQFNEEISSNLLKGAKKTYKDYYDGEVCMSIVKVPGAFEIPSTVKQLLESDSIHNLDAIVTLGCVIKGGTAHFEYISSSVTNSISKLSIESHIPIIYGILTTYDYEQALERSDPSGKDKGGEVMQSAIDTYKTWKKIL